MLSSTRSTSVWYLLPCILTLWLAIAIAGENPTNQKQTSANRQGTVVPGQEANVPFDIQYYFLAQKEITKNIVEELREELTKKVEDIRIESSSQANHIDELRAEVAFLKSYFFAGDDESKLLWLIEQLMERYNLSSAEENVQVFRFMLEVVQNWYVSKKMPEFTTLRRGASSNELQRIQRKFAERTEELLLILTNMNAFISSQRSSISLNARLGWEAFLEKYFNSMLVKIVTGSWFTLKSLLYPQEPLCFQQCFRNPLNFWAVTRSASGSDLRSNCLWKVVPVLGNDGRTWLHLLNKINSSSTTQRFREQDKVKLRILEPQTPLRNSNDDVFNGKFVVAIISKFTCCGGKNAYAPTTQPSHSYYVHGREIWLGWEHEIRVWESHQWRLQFID